MNSWSMTLLKEVPDRMPELSMRLSKTAQAMRASSPVRAPGGDANTPPIKTLRPTDHSECGSERLQEFNEVAFLLPGEIQLELPIVVVDHRPQIRRTPIVKIRRMLPESS
jgi:hypothetical protein